MINLEKLESILTGYKAYFPNHWEDEKYKWEAVKHFQKHWDIEAPNFGEMFKLATDKTYNLLASGYAYPRPMIINFAKADDETTRQMFRDLYDESKDLSLRVEKFQNTAKNMQSTWNDGSWKNHYQNTNAISTYLWLRYPDKYYIYKYDIMRDIAAELSADFRPKRNGSVESLIKGYRFYDEICQYVQQDTEIREMFREAYSESCYPDTQMRTIMIDIGFYVNRFYNKEEEVDIESLHSNARVVNWMKPVTETLLKMGGGARRPDVHDAIIKDYNISKDELDVVNSSGSSQVINDIDWARNYLVYEGFLSNEESGIWSLTDLGKSVVMSRELAEKIFAKWIRIKTAEREHKPVPRIDLTPAYVYREKETGEEKKTYTREDFLNDVFMTAERYDVLRALLLNKKNIILQGAPGVGKTFSAKRLAWSIMEEIDESRIEFIQFHQNYSYEDFVIGYRPDGDGFKLTEGVFYRFCQQASSHPDKKYFFIIDEINRGNMGKIFGELLMLIEKDYRGISATLAYTGEPFSVPENLYIIGMMNTADRSLAMIDYALRRRFSFFEIEPGFNSEGFQKYQEGLDNETFNALIEQVKALNKEIMADKSLGKGFMIGHSYFCGRTAGQCTIDWMRSVVEFDLLPTLSEYWFDEPATFQRWERNLTGVFDDE